MEFKVSGVFDLPRFSPEFMRIRQPYYHILFAASICARFISCHSRKINLFNSWHYVKTAAIPSKLRRTSGGEKGIRTLDTVPRIHDFQSCALDQLSHLSNCMCKASYGTCI